MSLLLFDSGYLFFYRYHATMKYLKFKEEEPDIDTVSEAFIDHLDKQIVKIKKKTKADYIIFCMDVPLKTIWRYKEFNEYKGTREHDIPIMKDINKLINKVMDKHGIRLQVDGLEADDIAYLCVKKLREKSDKPVNIITNDKDLMQIMSFGNVKIFDGGMREKKGDPHRELMYKILMGDKSDNIPSICGKVKATKLIDNPEELDAFLKTKNLLDRYNSNKMLIDMSNIPKEFQLAFERKAPDFLASAGTNS